MREILESGGDYLLIKAWKTMRDQQNSAHYEAFLNLHFMTVM